MSVLVLQNLSKHFSGTVAVDSLNLEVSDGELVVLVGPSGCGKTTTLRMIAGLEYPTGGVIRIDGQVVNDVPPKNRDIAMVFQHDALYPHLTVFKNMAFGLKMRRLPKVEIERRVRQAAERLGIAALLDRKPGALSGGQQQRVSLGRAIVRQPKVFLFDEPLSHLDTGMRDTMRSELAGLQRRLKTAMLYVTHDQVDAMTMGQRIIVMNHGRIQQIGTPHDVYRLPANRFVAEFIGSPCMRFLSGTIAIRDEALDVNLGGVSLPLPDRFRRPLASWKERPVTLGLRPEQIVVGRRPESTWPLISGEVMRVQHLGAETILVIRCHQHELAARVASPTNYRPGDSVDAFVDVGNCHVFDPSNGQAIR